MIFCFLIASSMGFAQKKELPDSFDIKKGSFVLPLPLPGGHYSSSLGVLYVVPPGDWTHDIIAAPMFSYQGKYSLAKGFNLQGSWTTLFISNRFLLGPFWNYKINDDYYVGAGWQVAWNYGRLYEFGFATTITGWEQQPSISFGRMFRTTAVTVRADLYWTNALYISEDKNVIETGGFINGYSLSAYYEQRLYKNRALTLGFQLDYIRYHIIAWPAFPVNKKNYWVPEFKILLNL